ncbi:putative porin [Puniceicoccaceae bacterium K14]|nr:putative porin [Puniceicoccaceae bacterium K14]
MKNGIIAVLGICCVGLGAYSIKLKSDISSLEADRSHAELLIQKAQAEEIAETVEEDKTADEKAGQEYVATATEVVPDELEEAERERTRDEIRRERMMEFVARFDDPESRLNMIDDRLNRVDGRYSDFFKRSGLSSDQIGILKTMLAERDVLRMEGQLKRRAAYTDAEREALAASMAQKNSIIDSEIASLIGEDLAESLEVYNETEPYRRSVDSLSQSLSYTSSPISEEQSEALVGIMASAADSFEYSNDLSNARGRFINNYSEEEISTYFQEREAYEQLLIANAREVLDDEQLAIFVEQQVSERESLQRRVEGGPGGGRFR